MNKPKLNPELFASYDSIQRENLVFKGSIYGDQILLFIYNLVTTAFSLKVFYSFDDAAEFMNNYVIE